MVSTQALANAAQNVTLPHIPELLDPNYLDVLLPPTGVEPIGNVKEPAKGLSNPLMDALVADNRTFTENNAPALKSTGSATLDAFNTLNAWSFKEINKALRNAWAEDPRLTLRVIWNMRSIHDGKGETELFYRSFGWLYDNHPRTAISNLHMLVAPTCTTPKRQDVARPHGYWKDLLNILALAACDELSNISRKANFLHNYTPRSTPRWRRGGEPKVRKTPQQIKEFEERARLRAKERRKELHSQFHERLVQKLTNDPKFRALYIAVTRLFAEQIRKDIQALDELATVDKQKNKDRYWTLLKSISLAGKWAPTPAGSHDKVTNISTAICQLLFSPNINTGSNAIGPLPAAAPQLIPDNAENCIILRSYYQHWILKPLREIISCPEPLMSARRWTEIRYNRVPSVCMARNKAKFFEHDPEGFQRYMIDVETGKKTISGATLMPHELVAEAMRLSRDGPSKFPMVQEFKRQVNEQQTKVVNAQWRTLISRLKESGQMDNALAVCDVSGSMGSIHHYDKRSVSPIFPSLGLSLVMASLAKPPFNAGFITFSATPEFVRLEGLEDRGLAEIVNEMVETDWGMNTDLQAVFLKLLLPLAKEHKIAKEDMIKRLFVFSDMQFDEASGTPQSTAGKWETNYDHVVKAYEEAGYDVPEIVYWNLAGRGTVQTVEVEAERKGVAMMSGFSSAMMKVFMGEADPSEETWTEVTEEGTVVEEKENQFTPLNVMKKALFVKSFDGLVVVD